MSEHSDLDLVCGDCNQTFVFTAEEQQRYAARNFSEPKRCPTCRQARRTEHRPGGRGFGGGGGDGGGRFGGSGRGGPPRRRDENRAMTEITCSTCGKTSQVPFEPAPDRPVYCQDCYRAQRGTH
jgi:CxxC-x17-CxxC domain-containing protein